MDADRRKKANIDALIEVTATAGTKPLTAWSRRKSSSELHGVQDRMETMIRTPSLPATTLLVGEGAQLQTILDARPPCWTRQGLGRPLEHQGNRHRNRQPRGRLTAAVADLRGSSPRATPVQDRIHREVARRQGGAGRSQGQSPAYLTGSQAAAVAKLPALLSIRTYRYQDRGASLRRVPGINLWRSSKTEALPPGRPASPG